MCHRQYDRAPVAYSRDVAEGCRVQDGVHSRQVVAGPAGFAAHSHQRGGRAVDGGWVGGHGHQARRRLARLYDPVSWVLTGPVVPTSFSIWIGPPAWAGVSSADCGRRSAAAAWLPARSCRPPVPWPATWAWPAARSAPPMVSLPPRDISTSGKGHLPESAGCRGHGRQRQIPRSRQRILDGISGPADPRALVSPARRGHARSARLCRTRLMTSSDTVTCAEAPSYAMRWRTTWAVPAAWIPTPRVCWSAMDSPSPST